MGFLSTLYKVCVSRIRWWRFRRQFFTQNSHNGLYPVREFNLSRLVAGNHSYGAIDIYCSCAEPVRLIIGAFCSIGPDVKFLLGDDHRMDTISTYPFKVKFLGSEFEAVTKGNIVVKDDVWLGAGVVVCSGVTIGQGAVVAAGAVVTKDVEPYAIVAGVPARLVKYRFEKEVRDRLMSQDLQSLLSSVVKSNPDLLYTPLDLKVLDLIGNSVQ